MKILLAAINAKFIHSNPAVYCLRAYAREWKAHTQISEYTINQLPEQILADLYSRKPDVIAFSCYLWNWSMIRLLLREIPKVLPHTALWLGGPEVSYDASAVLRDFPMLSGIMIGEGEKTFSDLCRYYVKGEGTLATIPGLCLPEVGYTGTQELIPLDDIPFFYDDLSVFQNRILYYETSRGCPYRCSYCLSSIDKTVRFRSLDKVYGELDFFLKHGVPQVKFIDRTFNCNHEHCEAIWRYLKEHDNGVTNFHFEIAANLLTEEEISLLQSFRPGLAQLEIGVQTTNSNTLSAVYRPMQSSRIGEIVARLRKNKNLHIHLDLIAGLPEEDLQSFRKSFDEVYRMGCEDLQLGFLKVLKGSYMEEHSGDYGLRYLQEPPYEVLSTRWISYGDLLELKYVEHMLEVYHNSNQFKVTLRQLEREEDSPYMLYLHLAEYYQTRGYELNQPSRMEKYRILLEFALSRYPEREELYRELLTFDVYSRENVRHRPEFALNPPPCKELLRKREANRNEHIELFFYRVWENGPFQKQKEPYLLVFDYDRRDPLTNNSLISVLYVSTQSL